MARMTWPMKKPNSFSWPARYFATLISAIFASMARCP